MPTKGTSEASEAELSAIAARLESDSPEDNLDSKRIRIEDGHVHVMEFLNKGVPDHPQSHTDGFDVGPTIWRDTIENVKEEIERRGIGVFPT